MARQPPSSREGFLTILCPVDFSAHSRLALRYAAAVARRSGGTLTALFVNDPFLVAAAAAAAAHDVRTLQKTSEDELRSFVRRAVNGTGIAPRSVACSIGQGEAAVEILRMARRLRADLIVVGTQGLSGTSKLFFGSTTERVLRRATVPVLAVPPGSGPTAGSSWPGRQILAALDIGPRLMADAHAAAKVARWFDTDLLLVHVLRPTQIPHWLRAALRGHDRERLTAARTRLDRLVRSLKSERKVEHQLLTGDPTEQIPVLAANSRTGLIVVTLRTADGLFGLRQGTITYQVLERTGTPVLALPKAWR
jgi:nucleotide-binding universal stress UspA family protein